MNKLAIPCLILFSALVTFTARADDDREIQQRIFQSYLELANSGDTNSQFIVASRYESGKGTERSREKAFFWYREASKKGHPLALRKLEEREAEEKRGSVDAASAEKTESTSAAPARVKAARPAAPPRAPEPVRTAVPEKKPDTAVARQVPETAVIAKAATAAEHPPASVNILQTVLGGKWNRNQRSAEILPSATTACLQSSISEVVCFSEELTRNVGSNGLTYSVKSTLSNLNGRDSRFSLRYTYNVVDINNKPFAQPSSTFADAGDLAARNGWQEPGIQMDCRLSDERTMSCARSDRKASYQFVRD